MKHDGLEQRVEPTTYRPLPRMVHQGIMVVVKLAETNATTAAQITNAAASLDADVPVHRMRGDRIDACSGKDGREARAARLDPSGALRAD